MAICHEPVAQGVSSTIWLPLAWWLAIIAHKLALACKVPYTLALLHWWHEYVLCAVTGAMVLVFPARVNNGAWVSTQWFSKVKELF